MRRKYIKIREIAVDITSITVPMMIILKKVILTTKISCKMHEPKIYNWAIVDLVYS